MHTAGYSSHQKRIHIQYSSLSVLAVVSLREIRLQIVIMHDIESEISLCIQFGV